MTSDRGAQKRLPRVLFTFSLVLMTAAAGCEDGGDGGLGDDCRSDSDCDDSWYTCVKCSGQNTCYTASALKSAKNYETACSVYGSGTPTDPRYRDDNSTGSGGGGSSDCSSAWTCPNDGQATPTCEWACTHPSGSSERAQTCKVLASMLESGNPGTCCSVCR
jgi:hypothetical protein